MMPLGEAYIGQLIERLHLYSALNEDSKSWTGIQDNSCWKK